MSRRAKLTGTDWLGVQKGDPRPILYFSGYACSSKELDVMERTQLKFRCMSYAFLGLMPEWASALPAALAYCQEKGVRVMLDSGAFTVQRGAQHKKLSQWTTEDFIAAYAAYVLEEKKKGTKFDFFITFDWVKRAEEVFRVTRFLRDEHGLRSTPVFHGDASLDWMDRYADDGHTLLCVGRVKALGSRDLRRYYERVFERAEKLKLQLHGLMVTGQNIFRFPWYSVDSATWTRLAANGRLVTIDLPRKKISHFRVSRVRIPTAHRELIKANGFDPDLLAKDSHERCIYNILEFLKISEDRDYQRGLPRWNPTI